MADLTAVTGNWHSTAASCTAFSGSATTAADNITIPNGVTVTIVTGVTVACRSITVANGGTLAWAATSSVVNIGDATAGPSNVALSIGPTATITLTGVGTMGFVSTSATQQTVTTSGKTMPSISVSGSTGSWVQADAILSSGSFTRTGGAWATGNYNMTHTTFVSSGTTARSWTLGTSTCSATSTATATVWNMGGSADTISGTSANIIIATSSTNTRTFAGGTNGYSSLTYTVAGSTGQMTWSSGYIDTLNFSDASNARTLAVPNTTTAVCRVFNVFGSAGKLVTVKDITAAGASFLGILGPPTKQCDYLSVQDITTVVPGKFYAGANSTDVSGNVGVLFTAPPALDGPYVRKEAATAGSGTTITATFTSYQDGGVPTAGHLLLAFFAATANPGTVTMTGWTQVATITNHRLFTKISDGTETSATATHSSVASMTLRIMEIDGLTGEAQLSYATTNGTGAAALCAAVTNTITPALVLAFWGYNASSQSHVSLTNSWTQLRLQGDQSRSRAAGVVVAAPGSQSTTETVSAGGTPVWGSVTALISSPSRTNGFMNFMPLAF